MMIMSRSGVMTMLFTDAREKYYFTEDIGFILTYTDHNDKTLPLAIIRLYHGAADVMQLVIDVQEPSFAREIVRNQKALRISCRNHPPLRVAWCDFLNGADTVLNIGIHRERGKDDERE